MQEFDGLEPGNDGQVNQPNPTENGLGNDSPYVNGSHNGDNALGASDATTPQVSQTPQVPPSPVVPQVPEHDSTAHETQQGPYTQPYQEASQPYQEPAQPYQEASQPYQPASQQPFQVSQQGAQFPQTQAQPQFQSSQQQGQQTPQLFPQEPQPQFQQPFAGGNGQMPGTDGPNRSEGNTVCGIIALVLGVLAFILSFIPLVDTFAILLAIVGVILSVVGLVGVFCGKKTGKVLTIIATVLNVLALIISFAMMAGLSKAMNEDVTKSQSSSAIAPKHDHDSKDSGKASGGAKSNSKGGTQDSEGDLPHAHVKIVSAVKSVNDFDGKPTALVTYQWTNKDTKNSDFITAMRAVVFQNGKELETTFYSSENTPQGYDQSSESRELQPGASETTTVAYIVSDNSPLTVEVTDLFGSDTAKISHTFNL
ncbi:DUF5067 domain-containing protein [Bifidobacterium bombi]|uniref:Integral membrane protein, putative tetraspanin family n=1 Tax=Bifidobacterium bombi DSM 19703 TaxID=1341695 RepID=A0A080N377_9BIFI|nr:DUF5067 domain-containing protein [Bifidobacterium bombi]KFF31578.1 integral membrane protein, putative tetraspanin family [Bifidobacterium bombi DSM 19703]